MEDTRKPSAHVVPITYEAIRTQNSRVNELYGLLRRQETEKSPERFITVIELREATKKRDAMRQRARKEFAAARGWRVSRGRGVTGSPDLDHSEGFRCVPGRSNLVLMTHAYVPRVRLEEFAHVYGYDIEILQWSWYFPGGAIAAILTPGTPAAKKRPFYWWTPRGRYTPPGRWPPRGRPQWDASALHDVWWVKTTPATDKHADLI